MKSDKHSVVVYLSMRGDLGMIAKTVSLVSLARSFLSPISFSEKIVNIHTVAVVKHVSLHVCIANFRHSFIHNFRVLSKIKCTDYLLCGSVCVCKCFQYSSFFNGADAKESNKEQFI